MTFDLRALIAAMSAAALTSGLLLYAQADRGTVPLSDSAEQLVFARSDDNVLNAGVLFSSSNLTAKPIAVIWVHGWGANFYQPTYVMIARALAERGVTTLVGEHAHARHRKRSAVSRRKADSRRRVLGHPEPASQGHRLLDWFCREARFGRVVLVGHSAGWAAVRAYQAERQDRRVIGLVLASGQVQPAAEPEPQLVKQAEEASRFVKEGRGDDLLRIPNRSFPSFISAATFHDDFGTPAELADFFGVRVANPAITRVNCPILAFFGTRDDVGTDADLKLLQSAANRHSRRVQTAHDCWRRSHVLRRGDAGRAGDLRVDGQGRGSGRTERWQQPVSGRPLFFDCQMVRLVEGWSKCDGRFDIQFELLTSTIDNTLPP